MQDAGYEDYVAFPGGAVVGFVVFGHFCQRWICVLRGLEPWWHDYISVYI